MITFIYGDLFASRAVALVNPVNCAGAMGTPPGRAFARRFPQMLADYQSRCTHGEVRIGEVTAFRGSGCVIVNLPTKRHWRDSGQLEEIDAGLHALRQLLIDERIPSIAIPALGGVGGPPWRDVEPRIAAALGDIPDIDIELYPPRRARYSSRGDEQIPRLIIASSRSVTDYDVFLDAISWALGCTAPMRVQEVVVGGAHGRGYGCPLGTSVRNSGRGVPPRPGPRRHPVGPLPACMVIHSQSDR